MDGVVLPVFGGHRCVVDAADFAWLSAFKWQADKRKSGLVYVKSRGKYLHRLIMEAGPGQIVDHINGNALDNRRGNLRFCTRSQNNYNKRKKTGLLTSTYKGVSKHKSSGLFYAFIQENGKRRLLGYFKDDREAAQAYNAAALTVYGEFARLNTIAGHDGHISKSA